MKIFIAIIFFVNLSFSQFSDSGELERVKIEQEQNIKLQVERILDAALGPGHNSIVNVSIEYLPSSVQKRVINKPTQKSDVEDRPWLPGFPGIPNIIKGTITELPRDQESVETRTPPKAIKRILITIDEKYPQDVLENIKKTIISQLALNLAQGDYVGFSRLPFKTGSPIVSSFAQDKFNILLLIIAVTILILSVFLFGPVRAFLNAMLRSMQRGREISIGMEGAPALQGAGGGATTALSGGVAGLPSSTGATAEGAGEIIPAEEGVIVEEKQKSKIFQPFSFIKKENLKNLVYLVQEERPETIALIMTYLNPDVAVELLSSLPVELQAKVSMALASVKQASKESILRTEEEIKKKIDFLVGGLEKFVEILDRMDPESKKEILDIIQKENPTLYERVRREIFTFENILDLEDMALQIVLREIKIDTLAKALKDAPQEIIDKIKSNISMGAQALLAEEMELTGYLTPVQIAEERKKIVDTIKQLEAEGKISIRKEKKKRIIEKVEKFEDDIGNLPSEKTISISPEKKETEVERKVTLEDYENKSENKFSIANIFKEKTNKKEPEEKFFTTEDVKGEKKPSSELAKEHYKKGMELYQKRDYDAALQELLKSVEINPSFWQAFQGIGNCYAAKGMVKEAIDSYEKSLLINPANVGLKEWLERYKQKHK
jgi:flagellar motor switch protein FliG